MGVWIPVFSLRSQHEYFSDGICQALDFVPTPNCERIILNQGMLLRREPGVLTAFADADSIDTESTTINFDFYVFSKDRQFLNYTDGLTLHDDGAYYLSSELSGQTAGGRLSKKEYVSDEDFHLQSTIPAELQYAGFPVPIFLVRITISIGNKPEARYTIPLRARRINWHYYITGSTLPGSELYVASKKGKNDFEYCEDLILPNGQKASHFRSKKALPLLHQQDVVYSLFERQAVRPVIKWLPTPTLSLIGSENPTGNQELSSQMYVNL